MRKNKTLTLLDVLVNTYSHISREKLFSQVLCGEVFIDGMRCRDPKCKVAFDSKLTLVTKPPASSRGKVKLEKAIETWNWPVKDRVFLDAGASTGGFTDALLNLGATFVHAVDVGTNQLHWRLRRDTRVGVYEQTNVMSVKQLFPFPHAAVVDLSFRSLRKAVAHILTLISEKQIIALVKPQFEWLYPDSDFRGIVPQAKIPDVLQALFYDLQKEGIVVKDQIPSPLLGRKGNQEYLVWFQGL